MYLLIEHCNGEIMEDPFIVYNEIELKNFIDKEYLIYKLDETYKLLIENVEVSVLHRYEEL